MEAPSSSSSIITPEDVLESLMNDGTIDSLRLKIINQLRANEELKNTTIRMAEQSKVLNTPGAEKQTKRELFDALRQELEAPVLEKASKSVWELILDNNRLGREISETVERVFCRLSGGDPPLFLQQNIGSQKSNDDENKGRESKEVEGNSQKEKSKPTSKKRSYIDMNTEGARNEIADELGDPQPVQESSNKSPQSASKTLSSS